MYEETFLLDEETGEVVPGAAETDDLLDGEEDDAAVALDGALDEEEI